MSATLLKHSVTNKIIHTFVYKQDLAFNEPQEIICYKTQPNKQKISRSQDQKNIKKNFTLQPKFIQLLDLLFWCINTHVLT